MLTPNFSKKAVNERKLGEISKAISTPEGRVEIAFGGNMRLRARLARNAAEDIQREFDKRWFDEMMKEVTW